MGVSFLVNFFQDKDSLPGDNVNSDGTTVKSSGCHLHLIWDHGQHVRNFMHGDSALPKIMLYQGNGYFAAFCSRLRQAYDNHIAYAFSSVFTISPSCLDDPTMVLDDEDFDEGTVSPACMALNNGYVQIKDDKDWYLPP